MEQAQWVKAARPDEVKEPATLPEEALAIMSRVDGTQAEDQGRTEDPAGIQVGVSDKAGVPGKAAAAGGNINKPGPKSPAFQN